MKKTYKTHSPEETKQVARELAAKLKGGERIALVGNLGAGKTTFVQGLAEALGSTMQAKSPTFALMNIYPTDHKKIKQLVHLDYYRIPDAKDDLGLEEYQGKDSVIVEEWPREGGADVMVYFEMGNGENERRIIVER